MKKIFTIIFLVFALNANAVTDENLDIKINQDVSFGDGFGTITGYPQNIAKEFRDKIKFIGEYNLDKSTGNLTIRFKRIQYDGKIYELTESYEKKMRLRKPKSARIKAGGKILVAGGNKQEILDIVNQKKQALAKAEDDNALKELDRGAEAKDTANLGSILAGGSNGTNSSSSNYPYYLDSTSDSSSKGDYSSATTQSDGTCKPPSISGGVVSVYTTTSTGGACKLFTTSESAIYYKYNQPSCQNKINKETNEVSIGKEGFVTLDDNKEYKVVACQYEPLDVSKNVYYKYNLPTCPNKVDYQNKRITLGREGFVTLDDEKEYKVVGCQYMPEQDLMSELSNCEALTDFKNKTARIQEKFFYMLNNEKVSIGGCTPTGEEVPLQEDINNAKCTYRHDFVRKLSIKQVQWFYMQGNKRFDVGGCVDKDEDGFRFPHFEDDTTCEYQVIDDKVFYKNRIAFNDLTGGKQFATDCRVTEAGGIEIKEELAGYLYQNDLRQAQRKVNQYFLTPHTGAKKYIAKDVLSDKTYPYKETLCKWEHHDDEKYSLRFSKLFFVNDDENVEVVVNECSDTIGLQTMPYVYLGEERQESGMEMGKTLIPQGDQAKDGWKIYGTETYILNTPNFSRNEPNVIKKLTGSYYDGVWHKDSLPSVGQCTNPFSSQEVLEGFSVSLNIRDAGGSLRYVDCVYNHKKFYGTNQLLKKETISERYRRGDGTMYLINPRTEWRAK